MCVDPHSEHLICDAKCQLGNSTCSPGRAAVRLAMAHGRANGLSVHRGRRAVGDRGASANLPPAPVSLARGHRRHLRAPHRLRRAAATRREHGAAAGSRVRAGRHCRRRHRHHHGPIASRRRRGPAAGQHGRADPGHRLCAAVPALVRSGQCVGRSARRVRLRLSHHLQHVDRREGREGGVGALGTRPWAPTTAGCSTR